MDNFEDLKRARGLDRRDVLKGMAGAAAIAIDDAADQEAVFGNNSLTHTYLCPQYPLSLTFHM